MTRRTCYMCTAVATSREHVPPQCLFPEPKDLPPKLDLRRNLITVPSCDEHNLEKSNDDVFLLLGLTLCIANNRVAMHHIKTKINRALTKDATLFGKFASAAAPVTAVADGVPENTLMMKVDNHRFLRSLDHVARGLYRHVYRQRFQGRCSIFPDFLLYADSAESLEMNERNTFVLKAIRPHFDQLPHSGQNPSVFNYAFMAPDENGRIALRMQFYSGSNVYVAFLPNEA
jgi:hypothetical protein